MSALVPPALLPDDSAADVVTPVDGPTFATLGLPAPLERAVADLGFVTPSAIQSQAVPALLAGRDIVGVAQTGTGKTAAFGLPLLAAVDAGTAGVQAIVLTPTRELAMQVADAITSFATHLPGLAVVAVYGGSPFLPQQRAIARGAQVVVGTPGRVLDHLDRGTLVLDQVRYLVLDEADEMLRMGFAEDVDRVLASTPDRRQVALFSATMPAPIRRVAEQHLHQPVEITVARQSSTVTTVRQTYAVVPYRHKIGALGRVLAVTDADATIVFVRTRGAAEEVGSALVERGISAAHISGDVAQSDREKIVDRLRSGALDVLVATDVAARGLDVERIGLVVNFDVPREAETYVHRIGRTGRAGREGVALSFVTPAEQSRLRTIERTTRVTLEQVPIPTPAEVSAHRVALLLGRTPARAELGRLDVYREAVAAHLAAHPGTDPIELLAAVTALAVGDEGPTPRDGDDLDDALERARLTPGRHERVGGDDRPPRERRRAETHIAGGPPRWRVAVGHRDGLQPGALVGALTGEGGLTGKDVGKIDIFGSFALVDIPGGLSADVVDRLSRTRVAGRPLRIRVDTGPRPGHGASRPSHGPQRGRH
ncbi:DEAD/DEAH box helicase [Cellulomonas fimi]|uniref:RNA helicase n=1 Tax=Cellulomonas fimi (strain ATCC 484 / DSM 20113 / JCM 1341 / CCUG 24087 / LMG 16345 / NBRC 15513 / NCIMB 8980 / NCTC 7547 / NRS-133) TaxID=590998 RepID=F4GZL4_CELFA|nr:DEAD/DEAH box helicase [Cellulomonas fimi]AEE46058.1 DEAD/DEAH box helicase domain protein [Cellulomonas fimi ATCC 484]NNH06909.1 DEAD/DEAH box helicase [Cellulomonas fimi]VEH31461.1 Cold-shock DEAD box protein A [Cellulomonas fimi]